MIQKPVIGLGVSCGLFSVCKLVAVATVFQALGAIAAGTSAMIFLAITLWKLVKGKPQ